MSRVLIAYPDAVVKALTWERDNIVIFDEAGFWVREGGRARKCVDAFAFPVDWRGAPWAATLTAVKRWSPLWTRWIANADQYELLYREAVIYLRHLAAGLTALGIHDAVIETGISHHLESSLLEMACVDAGVPQVFLYAVPLTGGRLLPLRQAHSIADRRGLGLRVSDYDATADIEKFREASAKSQPPRLGFFDSPVNRSYAFGVANALHLEVRRRLANARVRLTRPQTQQTAFFDQFAPLGAAPLIRLMSSQRRALKFWRRHVDPRPLSAILRSMTEPAVLLAAHFQPEATSFPEGGELGNHIDMVLALRSRGYDGPILYKEHIGAAHYYAPFVHQTRVGMARSVAYYQRLLELGCMFVSPGSPIPIDPEANRGFVPLTITGTIGLERSVMGLTTIVSGHPWYSGLPGTIALGSMLALRDEPLQAPAASTSVSDAAKAFLARLLSGTTIINGPGLGSGIPMSDAASVQRFNAEFDSLLQQLAAPAGDRASQPPRVAGSA